jgi:hypothetical protein
MEILNDDEFVNVLNELQSLYDTIDSLRNEISNDSEFNEVTKPMNSQIELLQESASRYVDQNTEEIIHEEENQP